MKVCKEALPYALFWGVLIAASISFSAYFLSFIFALPFFFTLFFFRDPIRKYEGDATALLSPADGKIIKIKEENGTTTISIFMSVFDVHINRSPIAGKIKESRHFQGTFVAAYKDKSSEENERLKWIVGDGKEEIEFVQIAGLVARRIHPLRKEGDFVAQGEKIGLIAFGSRVDIKFKTADKEILVKQGQKVKGGLTPMALKKANNER
ncbi:MAG: phosphatidylserine decarboxylase [Acidobacteria bacterium]|nr:phosphatidylserine decarboxylase [Acidobacteriota bacterium]